MPRLKDCTPAPSPLTTAIRYGLSVAYVASIPMSMTLADSAHATFPASLDLAQLAAGDGFRMDGESTNDYAGDAISSIGDINGDGYDDVIIGAPRSDPNNQSNAGTAYVVFGSATGLTSPFNLSGLDGTNGFKIEAEAAGDRMGFAVAAAGDFNGDGLDDFVITAPENDPGGNSNDGAAYVIFGSRTAFPATLQLSTIASGNGSAGFKILGENNFDRVGEAAGFAGDFNGDGLSDILLAAPTATVAGKQRAGITYVVFGRQAPFTSPLALSALDGSNGVRFNGIAAQDVAGYSVAGGNDINGDGIDDVIIGAPKGPDDDDAGASYVIFGRANGWTSPLELSDVGSTLPGFTIVGDSDGDEAGNAVGAGGDFNGDGIGDVIIGAKLADPDSKNRAGITYVIFGSEDAFPTSIDLGDVGSTTPGMKFNGEMAYDYSGVSVAFAGDVNGDGLDDVLIGAEYADPFFRVSAGSAYVVFGSSSNTSSSLNLADLDGTQGFKLAGEDLVDQLGNAVATAGDFNGDGVDDLMVAASYNYGSSYAGRAYVLFGGVTGFNQVPQATAAPATLTFPLTEAGQTSSAQTLTLTNSGTGPLSVGALSLTGSHAADFALSNDTCSNQTIAINADCTVDVAMTPTAGGTRSATLSIPSNALTTPESVPVTGEAFELGSVSLSRTSVDFGSVQVAQASTVETITVTNGGPGALTIGQVSVAGTHATDFAITANTCDSQTLANAASCSIGVTMTPSATGSRSASLSIPSDAASSPDAVTLEGTAFNVGTVGLSATTLDFGASLLGTASTNRTLTVTNLGPGPIVFNTVTVMGTDASNFSIQSDECASQTIANGAQCRVVLSMTPSAVGNRSATLNLASNAASSPDAVTLSGSGFELGEASLSSNALNFGSVIVGVAGETQTITVTNEGPGPLTIGQVALSGAHASDFVLINDGCSNETLALNETCTVGVQVSAVSSGSRSATLTIPTDNGNEAVTLASQAVDPLPVPTLTSWWLALMASLFGFMGWLGIRRH